MKPSIPKGTRDFSSETLAKRNYIFSTIQQAFETFGFAPIETPSFENSSTLMGKYGEEGDRLIFKILNSGDYLKDISKVVGYDLASISSEITQFLNDFFIDISEKLRNKVHQVNYDYEETITFISDYIEQNFDVIFRNHCKGYMNDYRDSLKKNISNHKIAISNLIFRQDNFFTDTFDGFNEIVLTEISSVFSNNIYNERIKSIDYSQLSSYISEKALRYDLTVPFARYVAQHQNEITFPFKRYQIQPVWRADRPQKGRFREFYQCDADVVGSRSLLQEVEFIQLYDTVFSKLQLQGTTIKINNRKILSGIAEVIGAQDKLIDFTVALDKLDKIGKEGVVAEMIAKGIAAEAIKKADALFHFTGTNLEKLDALETLLVTSEEGLKGVEELRFVIATIADLGLASATLELDVTLARGLNYYTGAIFEVAAPKEVKMGSIGGGGRYDDLTGVFGLKDVGGVGISFGLDRIYLVLEELNLFQSVKTPKPTVLFLNFEATQHSAQMKALQELRAIGISAEIYPDVAQSNKQQKKQWKYADTRDISYVVTAIEDQKLKVKNRLENQQFSCTLEELIHKIQ